MDDRANAELHSELEQKTIHALRLIRMAMDRGAILLTDDEFSALCYAAGMSPHMFHNTTNTRRKA